MTDQNTNGPVDEAAIEAAALERGAELSAQIVRAQPAAEATPERTAAELRARLELIREVKRTAMTENLDYGVVPGTDKPGLLKPGGGEAGARVQARCPVEQRADLGPGRAPHRDLASDRLPRADRHPPGLRGGDLLKPRVEVCLPQRGPEVPGVRQGDGAEVAAEAGRHRWQGLVLLGEA